MATSDVDLILGTAGHIDHGKSTLIQALTGTDPDRLKEEKERGITIELGFAQLALPSGRKMGVVDVPGHERFVRQMIAGATGIDVALLVVAADDGVMPQTREHVAVLATLGVKSCVVALTKIDMVDADWATFMADEVAGWLATTTYADAEVIPVSARTGEGLPELLAAIDRACGTAAHDKLGEHARMPIDRVFTIKGAGTVVTGTLWSGTVGVDDVLEIVGSGRKVRVRSVQVHNKAKQCAKAGNRVAINLSNVSTSDLCPGDFLASVGLLEATDRFDARITYLDVSGTGHVLETGVRMHIAHGTREVLGRVLLADGQARLASGESCLAQLRLEEPLPVSAGDRFIMRTYSPVAVAGGGSVLLAHPKRRTNLSSAETEMLSAVEAGDLQTAVEHAVQTHKRPVTAAEIARLVGAEEALVAECLEDAARGKRVVRLDAPGTHPALFATQSYCSRVASAIERLLIDFHAEHPVEAGIAKPEVATHVAPQLEDWRFEALVGWAAQRGKCVVVGDKLGHPSSQDTVAAAENQAADTLEAVMRGKGVNSPALKYLLEESGLDAGLAHRALGILKEQGRAVQVAGDYWLDAATLSAAKAAIRELIETQGPATAAQIKETLNTSRKYCMPLLEYLDAAGFTVRDGDLRTLA